MKKFIVAVAALALMAGSAYAADWNFYGSARVATFYDDVETINSATASTKNISESLQTNARIGANVKVSDELAGRFEYGTGTASTSGVASIRLLFGEWNFGAGKLLVGQDYTPLYLPGSNQVYGTDNGLGGWGEVYGGRKAQLKLSFGDFQLALVQPNTYYTTASINGLATASATHTGSRLTANSEVKVPQVQARYDLKGDNWDVRFAAGYQTFEVNVNNSITAGAAQDVTSYYLAVGGNLKVGQFTLNAQVHGGENPGNLIAVDVNGGSTSTNTSSNGFGRYVAASNTVVDNEAFGWRAFVNYAINDMFALELGYGQNKIEYDEANSTSDEVKAWYVSAPITLAPGVFVVPEVGMYDYQENGQTETTYFGAKWQINF